MSLRQPEHVMVIEQGIHSIQLSLTRMHNARRSDPNAGTIFN